MITVFIGTYNRLDTLKRSVTSYGRLDTELELVIVDNGTDHPRCLDVLSELEKHPLVKKIYSLPKINTMEEATDNFNVAVADQYKRDDADWFAVSEADVSFEQSDPDSINAYLRVAQATKRAIGPHLRVDRDIPWTYPLRSRVLTCESRIIYKDDMEWVNGVPFSAWPIDTTFHLFPRTGFFHRLKLNTARVGYPYDALHLDWYLDIFNPTEENRIYIQNRLGVGSWGRLWLSDFWYRFQNDKEDAFAHLGKVEKTNGDLCNTSFLISWCYQYGQGVERNQERSISHLWRALPRDQDYHQWYYWSRQADWMKMIYNDDFTGLGWNASD